MFRQRAKDRVGYIPGQAKELTNFMTLHSCVLQGSSALDFALKSGNSDIAKLIEGEV